MNMSVDTWPDYTEMSFNLSNTLINGQINEGVQVLTGRAAI